MNNDQAGKSGLIAPKVTEGEWKAEVDEALRGGLHTEQMREIDPAYQQKHPYMVIHSWINGGGRYVAETGCHAESEANAQMLAASKKLAEALNAVLQENPSVEDWMNAKAALLLAGYTEQAP
jgi:hypothetical protein